MFRQTAAYSYQPPDRPGFRCHRRLSTILTMRMVMKMMVICISSPQNSEPSFTSLPQLQLLHLYGFFWPRCWKNFTRYWGNPIPVTSFDSISWILGRKHARLDDEWAFKGWAGGGEGSYPQPRACRYFITLFHISMHFVCIACVILFALVYPL